VGSDSPFAIIKLGTPNLLEPDVHLSTKKSEMTTRWESGLEMEGLGFRFVRIIGMVGRAAIIG